MFRHAMVAVALCVTTLIAGFAVDAKARGMMVHSPWPTAETEVSPVVVHETPQGATLAAAEQVLTDAKETCGELQATALSVAEVSIDAGGETSTQIEVSFACVPS